MGSTEQILDCPRPSASDAEETASSGGPQLMACLTCAKKGEHSTSECPYKDLIKPSAVGSPPGAVDRTAPRVCPVCRRNPADRANPTRRRRNLESSVRVCVDNLPEATREADLRNLFCPFGVLTHVSLSPDDDEDDSKPGRPRAPHGVVEFVQAPDAQKAINRLDGYVYGDRVLRAEWAAPYVPPPICARCLRDADTCVRVSNLSEDTRETDLFNLSCPYGVVVRVHLAVDEKAAGSGRQIGIVKFVQGRDAEMAVGWLNGYVYDNLVLPAEGPLRL